MQRPLKRQKKFEWVLDHLLLRSWWVWLFVLMCYGIYERSVYSYREEYFRLNQLLKEFNSQLQELTTEQNRLILQVNSQSDPCWIELTLKKELGLAPEGQVKFYFVSPNKLKSEIG